VAVLGAGNFIGTAGNKAALIILVFGMVGLVQRWAAAWAGRGYARAYSGIARPVPRYRTAVA
jgi:hypothetical protein